ncbi:MAG: DUF58 domain-containing protein [Bacillota bacterium]
MIALSVCLAVFVGGRPLAMLANAALLLLGAMWLWVRLSLGNLSVYLEPERPVLTSADRVLVRVRLNNEGFLPLPRVEVKGAPGCRPRLDVALEGRVPALGTSSAMLGPLNLPRGAYRLGPIEVEARDPLGLWRASTRATGDRVTVYPRVLPLEAPPVVTGKSFGRMRTGRPGQEDFSNLVEVRAFQPGDNPRLIDWKATARRGSWQVRVLEEGALAEVWLFLDAGSEAAVELAASLARRLILSGSLVGLVGQGIPPVTVVPGRGEAKWREIMQGLLRVQAADLPLGELLGARQASLPRGATVIAITPRLDALLFDRLLRVRQGAPGTYLVLVGAGVGPDAGAPAGRAGAEAGPHVGVGEALAAGAGPVPATVDWARVGFLRERGGTVLVGRLVGEPLHWRLEPARLALDGAGRAGTTLARGRRSLSEGTAATVSAGG